MRMCTSTFDPLFLGMHEYFGASLSPWIPIDIGWNFCHNLIAFCWFIDNHDSGYLGMAVQLYLQAYLGHYHILTQKENSQKLIAQLKSTPLFTYICVIWTSENL